MFHHQIASVERRRSRMLTEHGGQHGAAGATTLARPDKSRCSENREIDSYQMSDHCSIRQGPVNLRFTHKPKFWRRTCAGLFRGDSTNSPMHSDSGAWPMAQTRMFDIKRTSIKCSRSRPSRGLNLQRKLRMRSKSEILHDTQLCAHGSWSLAGSRSLAGLIAVKSRLLWDVIANRISQMPNC
jgi:hypothetical protein